MSSNNTDGNKLKEFIKKFPLTKNQQNIILLLGVSGIALIFISGLFTPKKDKNIACGSSKIETSMTAKKKSLEESLENIVSGINGAGKAKVMITFEGTSETVYATEEKKNNEASEDKSGDDVTRKKESNDCEKKFITVKDCDGGEKALAVTELEPKIKGAVVICQGGDDPIVKNRITEAVTTALNINSSRVCITKSN